jgi:YebC/PmpR family DNA-binding regulatory protein
VGKGWKKAGMLDVAQKKGKLFTKMAKEIYIASKLGGGDPDGNPRLKMAIRAALDVSCPKNTIDRAVKKGTGQLDGGETIEEITYEGQAPNNVGIIIECQTDNKNRTVSELRGVFKKNGGSLGDKGSSAWMFEHVSLIEGITDKEVDPEEEAIEAGANEVEKNEDGKSYSFYGNLEDLDSIRTNLADRSWEVTVAKLSYLPKTITELSDDQRVQVEKILELLDDLDDTSMIYASI